MASPNPTNADIIDQIRGKNLFSFWSNIGVIVTVIAAIIGAGIWIGNTDTELKIIPTLETKIDALTNQENILGQQLIDHIAVDEEGGGKNTK